MSLSKRIKNNVRARRMALNAGLSTPDALAVVGIFGARLADFRTSMLRVYRQHRREKVTQRWQKPTPEAVVEATYRLPWYRRLWAFLNRPLWR